MFAQKCLDRDPVVVRSFTEQYQERVFAYLVSRGAEADMAAEVVTQLWADCVMGNGTNPPKLHNFNGQSSLQTWLNIVALNDWLTRVRRQTLWLRKAEALTVDTTMAVVPRSAESSPEIEELLLQIMCNGLQAGFAACTAQDYVLLHLVAVHELKFEEVGNMFNCSETSVRRMLVQLRRRFKTATFEKIRETDPHLELTWADFMGLCQNVGPGYFGLDLD